MIEVSGIRKEYEGVAAVDCLDLTIEEGSFFWFAWSKRCW